MQYILMGFTHDTNFRVFAFESIGKDKVRADFKVRADLVLARKYGIRVQELPLLCREVLERLDGSDLQQTVTYAEADMSLYADACSQRANAQKKKPLYKQAREKLDLPEKSVSQRPAW